MRRRKKLWLLLAGTASTAGVIYVFRAGLAGRMADRRRRLARANHRYSVWAFDSRVNSMRAGATLRIEAPAPAVVHWSTDQWDTVRDTPLDRVRAGLYAVDLPTENLPPGARVLFTFYWPDAKRWEGQDFQLTVEPAATSAPA